MISPQPPPQRTPPDSCPWETNLAALRPINPALAERLAGTADCGQWQRQIARDGSTSFQRPADATLRIGASLRSTSESAPARWLGGTSVPRAAAEAIVEGMELPAAGTFCLDGGAAGVEIGLLLARLGRTRSLAATCADAQQAALWLHLHDWSEPLADGRLLLFAGEDRWKQMAWFFSEHTGFEPPSSVASWPTVEPEQRLTARRECRTISQHAAEHRAKRRQAVQVKLQQRSTDRAPGDLAVLAAEPIDEPILLAAAGRSRGSRRWSRLLADALAEAGADVRVVEMDSPATATGLPLGEVIAEADPAAAMLLDRLRPDAGALLPTDLPVLSWLVGPQFADADAEALLDRIGDQDRLVCAHAPLVMALRKAGLAAERCLYCPPPADPALLAEPLDDERDGVAIVGDVTVPDPKTFGITLPSLRALWDMLCDEIGRRWIPYSDEAFETFLQRAGRRVEVELEAGSAATVKFTQMLRRIAADNQLLIAAATDLARRNVPLRLYGAGWSQIEPLAACVRGPADEAGCREAVTRSAVLLHLSTRTNATDLVADAAAAGCAVLIKPLPSDPSNHGAAALLKIGTECQSIQDIPGLLRSIERLTKLPAARIKQTTAARAAIQRNGLMSHRLAALRRFLVQ